MQVVIKVKLLPDEPTASALTATLAACNQAADWVSRQAYDNGLRGRDLRSAIYHEVKDRFGLSAQPAQHVIKKVSDSYKTLKALCDNGVLKGKRRVKAESKPLTFRPTAAQPYDLRCLSWQHDQRTISIWTVSGRLRIPYTGDPGQVKQLASAAKIAESDLVSRDGMWFVHAVIDVPVQPKIEPRDWIGVDRGITNIATSSDGRNFCGKALTAYRKRCARLRAKLQAKGTKSAKRLLKKRRRREQRHVTNTNHIISKTIVADAQRTGRGIALETLQGIRDRVRLYPHQRATIGNWAFHQLAQHIGYKAKRGGVPVIEVDARHTSQQCPRCYHTTRSNRPSRDDFRCRRCGLAGPADLIAAVNVRNRARIAWVFVSTPYAACTQQPVTQQEPQSHPDRPGSKLGPSRPRS